MNRNVKIFAGAALLLAALSPASFAEFHPFVPAGGHHRGPQRGPDGNQQDAGWNAGIQIEGVINDAAGENASDITTTVSDVRKAIKNASAKWSAAETSVSRLSREEQLRRVGLGFQTISAPPLESDDASYTASGAVDWRDHNGNFVTGVRDQGNCGSCWAFAMTGGLESYALTSLNEPGKNLDLSEQVFLSCSGAGSCDGGTLDPSFLQKTGLPPEKYYPYSATDGTCSSAAAGWQKAAYKVGEWKSVAQKLASIKAALSKYGPLPTALMVYQDFMYYKSGVYSYTSGKQLGGHAVLLVGYNDDGQYFIVKNSWGKDWGEKGYFKIAYSEITSKVDLGLSTVVYKTGDKTAEELTSPYRFSFRNFDPDATWQRILPIVAGKLVTKKI